MRTRALDVSDPDGPLVIEPIADAATATLDRAQLIALFERHGVLLFRGFDLTPQNLVAFTDRFAEQYAPDAAWREARFGQKQIRTVNTGALPIPLHSEASFAAAWPEIIFFYCSVPPSRGGATTICDGVKLLQRLSLKTQRLFTSRPVKYEIALEGRKTAAGGDVEWPMLAPGVSGIWDRTNGIYRLSVIRNAVHETRYRSSSGSATYSFCNGAMIGSNHSEIKRISFADGEPIADDVLAELAKAGEEVTLEISWQPRDLLMIDNWRFMHGRRAFDADDVRDISIVQVLRASFGFGATTRGMVADT